MEFSSYSDARAMFDSLKGPSILRCHIGRYFVFYSPTHAHGHFTADREMGE